MSPLSPQPEISKICKRGRERKTLCEPAYILRQGGGRSISPSPLKYGLGDISTVKQFGGESTFVGVGGGGGGSDQRGVGARGL